MYRRTEKDPSPESLIGVPRIALVLGVSYPTAALYAARRYFPIQVIADVLHYKALKSTVVAKSVGMA